MRVLLRGTYDGYGQHRLGLLGCKKLPVSRSTTEACLNYCALRHDRGSDEVKLRNLAGSEAIAEMHGAAMGAPRSHCRKVFTLQFSHRATYGKQWPECMHIGPLVIY